MAFASPPALIHRPRRTRLKPCTVSLSLQSPHLPPHAYTTLPDSTPVCRLITFLQSRDPSPSNVSRTLDTLLAHGYQTFSLPPPLHTSAASYVRLIGRSAADRLQLCTRLDINPSTLNTVSKRTVEDLIDNHLRSLSLERLHMVQFSWTDFRDKRYLDFLNELSELQRVGKLRSVGTANFPTRQLRYLHSQGIKIASNQVPFSLLDERPMTQMAPFCTQNGIALVAANALGGGFFSERYLGLPEPRKSACSPALLRFAGMIRVWGGWGLFQQLLYEMKGVANKYGVSMANVAVNWVLRQPFMAVGLEVESAEYCESNLRPFLFELDDDDLTVLQNVARKGNDLFTILGDSGSEFQDMR
ncbi:NADP-dependent oxidoreductase [Gracilaria domingensis]|nr:NADP-dependent oxidoreductase [Gracilaria domingensis]